MKLARDKHNKMKVAFQELSGKDMRWFGPEREMNDRDYELSEGSDIALVNEQWEEVSEEELDDQVGQEKNKIKKTEEEKVVLKMEHDRLLQKLMKEAESELEQKQIVTDDAHEWLKEQFNSKNYLF